MNGLAARCFARFCGWVGFLAEQRLAKVHNRLRRWDEQ